MANENRLGSAIGLGVQTFCGNILHQTRQQNLLRNAAMLTPFYRNDTFGAQFKYVDLMPPFGYEGKT